MEDVRGIEARAEAEDRPRRSARAEPEERMDRRNRRLAGQVFDHLRDDIVRGVLPPGTPMAELDLCNRLGVSRTPVREALIKLAEEGLVRIYPQRGTFVAPVSVEAFREAQFIREHLECALVAEASRRIDASGLRQLRSIIGQQEQCARDRNPELFYELDEAFHNAIARISGHTRVWQVVVQAKVHFDRVRYYNLQTVDELPLLINQHTEIVEGLAACDEAKAVAAMRRHLREVFRTIDAISQADEASVQSAPRRRRAARSPAG